MLVNDWLKTSHICIFSQTKVECSNMQMHFSGICMGEDYEFSGQRILELLGKAGKLLHECHIYEGVEEVRKSKRSKYRK